MVRRTMATSRGAWGLGAWKGLLPPVGLAVTTMLLLPFDEHPFFVALALSVAGAALLGTKHRSAWVLGALPVGLAGC